MRFVVICVLTLVIITALVCGINPQMHKRVVILDHKYKVVDTVEPAITETKVVTQAPIVKTQEVVKAVSQTKVTPVQPVSKTTTKVQTVKTKTVPATTVKTQPVQTKPVQAPKAQTQTVAPKPVQTAKPVQTVLTPQQETILWNKWRSDLQNKIMDSVPMPSIAQGVVFKFNFRVDKYGKITNIKSWSTDPKYNPIAIQYINPVIRNLQGTAILKFPEGSARDSVLFEGNMRVSTASKYSTVNDYNDIENIKH